MRDGKRSWTGSNAFNRDVELWVGGLVQPRGWASPVAGTLLGTTCVSVEGTVIVSPTV